MTSCCCKSGLAILANSKLSIVDIVYNFQLLFLLLVVAVVFTDLLFFKISFRKGRNNYSTLVVLTLSTF